MHNPKNLFLDQKNRLFKRSIQIVISERWSTTIDDAAWTSLKAVSIGRYLREVFHGFDCVKNTCIAITTGETASDPLRPIRTESRVPVIILIGYIYIYIIGFFKGTGSPMGGGSPIAARSLIDIPLRRVIIVHDNAADAGITVLQDAYLGSRTVCRPFHLVHR